MSARIPRSRATSLPSIAALLVVAAAALGLGLSGRLPPVVAASIALGGAAISGILQSMAPRGGRAIVPLPAIVALGVLGAAAPIGPAPELLAGASGVALLAWLAEDPHRPPLGALRGSIGWALPALAVGLAWAGSFLLPPDAAPAGVAGALLAAAIVALAYLFRRPEVAVGAPTSTI